nr:type IV secretory system conjugative DNA transfer family protein [Ruthenibacterium lactatiformans]
MKPQQGRTARYILWALGFPLALWLAAALADAFSGGASLSRVLARFSVCMNAPFSVRWTKDTGRFLLLAGLLYPAGAVAVESGRGNRRPGEEYGSARWGDPRTIGKKYRDRRHREKNILLTQHVALGLDGRITKRNTHQLVVGGSGAGKTRYFCLPNVMNACCSYIITDCKGEILRAVGGLLEKQGIPFTVLDLVNMRGHYNPFAYLRRDSDALRLVTNLVANTTPKDAKNSDPFWDRAETALLQALILYLKHRAPVCEQNFTMVMEMINAAEVREGDPNFKSALDLLFDELESEDPQSIALKQYKVFKQAQDKTAKSILIGAAVRLAAFNLPELARVTDSDEMYIGRLGEEKRAIFCVIPDNDTSLNFLVSMLYTQAFQELYYIADQKYGGPLPVHVQCIQDEWANTPQPDNYLQILRTARSRNIGCSVVVQGLSAIKAMYKESWEEVVGNCDSFLFLGGNDQESLSYISKMTGKATIDTITRGETKGRGGSSSRNFQNTGRELVTPEELRMVDRDALLLIRGECPVMDRKYDLNRHPNIRYTEMGGAPPYKVPEDYCVLSAGIPAEDVQEEWKKGTPLAPELLSAFEVLHSKEELEEKKIERKKNKPDAAALRDAKRGHKARIGYARIVLVCLLGALLAVPAFAEGGASGPLDTINNLSDLVFQCVRAVGVIVAGYGIVQIGLAVQSHDSSQRANGFLAFFGGLLIMFAKEILDFITV